MADETTTDTRAVEVLAKHTADVSSYDSGDLHGCGGCDWTPPLGVGGVEWPAFYVHQAAMLAEAGLLREERDPAEPCGSEVWSMDYYRDGQVDPYWIRCNALGPHDEHEDANTGLTWPVDPKEA